MRLKWGLLSGTSFSAAAKGLALGAVLLLGGVKAVQAIVLNDGAAERAGGISNAYDRNNTMSNVVSLFIPPYGTNCTGTLINSRTVLTAAHCIVSDATNSISALTPNTEIRFAPIATQTTSADRPLSGVTANALYGVNIHGVGDIAVLSLSAPVTNVRPVTLITRDMPIPQPGALAVISGYGQHGIGSNPPQGNEIAFYDNKRRIGQTIIGGYMPTYPDAPPVLLAQFRNPLSPGKPDIAGLDKLGIPVPPLQASTAPGDSGGPIFLVTKNGLVQLGTVIGTPGGESDGLPGYGDYNDWASLWVYLDWVYANNPLRQVISKGGNHLWSDPAAWTDLYTGEAALPNNRDGSFKGYGKVGRYYQASLVQPGTVTLDMKATVDDLSIEHAEAALDIAATRSLQVITSTNLYAGQLIVNGTLKTGVLNLTGGILTGGGSVQSLSVNNTGSLVAPVGTLRIVGNYAQSDAGSLSVRLIGTDADRLVVTGQANLGGTLQLAAGQGALVPDATYTVLQAGTVIGRFDTVETGFASAFLGASVAYAGNIVQATVERNGVTFSDVAWTADDKQVADAIESAWSSNPIGDAILQLDAPSARGAFDSLSGEAHASVATVAYGDARLVQNSVLNRLRQPFMGSAVTVQASYTADKAGIAHQPVLMPVQSIDSTRFALWGEGFGSWGRIRSDGNAASVETSTGGFVLGADAKLNETFRLGIAGGFINTNFDVDARLSSGSNDSVFGALYGSGQWGGVNLRLGGSYAHHDIDLTRSIGFLGFADRTGASYGGSTLQAFGELGYRFELGTAQIEPFLGASVLRLHMDGFVENGGLSALAGSSRAYDLGTTTLGVRSEMRLSDEVPLTFKGLVGWRHAFGDVEPEALLGFANAASSFTVSGTPIDRDALVAEAGIDWQATQDISLGIAYNGQLGNRAQDHALKGNFMWRF